MKRLFLLIVFLNSLNAFCQSYKAKYVDFTEINVSRVEGTFGEKWCMDSAFRRSQACPLGFPASDVEFFKAYYNDKANKLLLIGRAKASSTVSIFISNCETGFTKDSLLSYTTESSVNSQNFGFFEIAFTLNNKRSLFFFTPNHSYTRFDIGRLQQSLNAKSKRFR